MPRTPDRLFRRAHPALLSAIALMLAGCASVTPPAGEATKPATAAATATTAAPAAPPAAATPPAAGASAAAGRPAGAAPAPTAAARPPAPGQPPAFADVTKDAKSVDGFLPVWTKDEKTWLEIPAALLDKPMFLGNSLASGLGERSFWPGMMGSEKLVVLRRVGNSVQLVARNLHARGAAAGSPLERALQESYSDSLLAAAPLAAAPHAERKSLLVDAQMLLGGDLPSLQPFLEMMYRMPYSLDRGNSSIVSTKTAAGGTSLVLRQHFAVPRIPTPPVMVPGAPPPNPAMLPNPSQVLPDVRSLFLNVAYTLAPLPEQAMKPRRADQRVGYFTDAYMDFGADGGGDRRTHVISRWRLEKKDPAAELSEPKEPIRVVMDRNIPEKWREPVKAGILEWNKAFERAGFRNAIALEQQPADADWSTTEGTKLLAVRWFALEGPGATAVGPSQTDPRSGEILRGAAIIPENWVRVGRTRIADTQPRLMGGAEAQAAAAATPMPGDFAGRIAQCSLGSDALEQAQLGFDLLVARGEMDPNGPEAERFIADSLKDVVMHEVGHALGLRHNFRGSTGVTRAQLRDAGFTAQRGVSNSIMDYNALNLPLEGEAKADVQMRTLGAYDFWAIEYGYREYPAEQEAQALSALAARSAGDTSLAYATDEDAAGPDPQVNRFDLGDDPLAFAGRQLKLARELWQRTATRTLPADDDMSIYRRNLQRMLAGLNASVPLAVRHVGGVLTSRALAGANQPLLAPVPAARQREALGLVLGEVFGSASFRFDPKLMSRLGVDQNERLQRFSPNTDFSLGEAVLSIQRPALDFLMADGLAVRLADAEVKVEDPKSLLSFAEVQQRLADAVWAELKAGKGEIDSLRRNLQREHLRRLAGGVLRPGSAAAADVRAVQRQTALALQAQLSKALAAGNWTPIARAHLADSLATLSEALKAPLVRQGV
ncbi:MAG: zinc-dependent metalloprotease [Burkholderiaceae bacterium]|nr:zinc-dependent metalloprotease [Burkholderiaceae bacterium]